jgi:hypothetical protein
LVRAKIKCQRRQELVDPTKLTKKLDTTSSLALLLGRCDGMDAKGIGKFKIFISHVRGRGHLYR